MFTGIIEAQATVEDHVLQGENLTLWLSSSLTVSFKVDQSLSHNGACLTVEAIKGDHYKVSAVLETRQKTNIDSWKVGSKVNLERAMRVGDRPRPPLSALARNAAGRRRLRADQGAAQADGRDHRAARQREAQRLPQLARL